MSKTQEQLHFETLKTIIHLNFLYVYIAVMHFENDEKKQRKTDSVLLIRRNREAMEDRSSVQLDMVKAITMCACEECVLE